jgi:hypothetical protein
MIEHIKSSVLRHSKLSLKVNKNEYRVMKSDCKGSLWIGNWKGKKYNGTRVQTTGEIASILDKEIELLKSSNYIGNPKGYKYWYVENAQDIEKLIDILGQS